jgi:hypothetical protein
MACGCQGQQPKQEEPRFEVKLPDGQTMTVEGEHAAKVAVTKAGGGTYSRI